MMKPTARSVIATSVALSIVSLGVYLMVAGTPSEAENEAIVRAPRKEAPAPLIQEPPAASAASDASATAHPVAEEGSPEPIEDEELSEQELIERNEEDRKKQPFAGFAEAPEQRAERMQERSELLGRWDDEASDQSWTVKESSRIESLLATAEFSSDHLKSVDCRETICRFQLQTSNNTQGEVMSLIGIVHELNAETWLRAEPQEREPQSHIEVFFSREGYRLSGGGGRIDAPPVVVHDAEEPAEASTPERG